ncbi:unnamed protein product [Cuscuta europaea]|uniref:Uncharacterized protein n=1 Tax=Cuscuta europaea TaxID=41803 RepID=A0A9P0YCR8_CUSEU|nr:unnamed protein product [Cuscuta europaea]
MPSLSTGMHDRNATIDYNEDDLSFVGNHNDGIEIFFKKSK